MEKDYYKILGVTPDADSSTIKKAFRKLAKQYHPDTNGGDARIARKFQEINEAYSVLGEEAKRKAYDAERPEKEKKQERPQAAQMDFTDVSSQFTNFFGFRPK